MNKLTHNFAVKTAAVLLFCVFSVMTVVSLILSVVVYDYGMYNESSPSFYNSGFITSAVNARANEIYYNYYYSYKKSPGSDEHMFRLKEYENKYKEENTNLFFTLKDSNGDILLSNYKEQNYSYVKEFYYTESLDLTLTCYVRSSLTAEDSIKAAQQNFFLAFEYRYTVIAAAVVSALLSLVLFIFLMCASGRRKGAQTAMLNNGIDRIPLDLYAALVVFASFLSVGTTWDYYTERIYYVVTSIPLALFNALLYLSLFMTFAARYKVGGWWRNTLVFKIIKLMGAFLKNSPFLIRHIPVFWKLLLGFTAICFVEFVFIIMFISRQPGVLAMLWLLERVVFGVVTLLLAIQVSHLREGAEKIAAGGIGFKINTDKMLWSLKKHGENLNNIGDGLAKAVDERMRSERLKTELITNVSHDIKTPMTSIVNYVDLLKKESIENETAREYIGVLDRQSARLRKMTDDLVEASKATSGNISVSPVRTDIKELLKQAVGEYDQRLRDSGLEPILSLPDDSVFVYADGRLLWRVFDNLLSNVCKYSLSGTRVYFSVISKNNKTEVSFKNISMFALDADGEILTERFFRGDSSRSTEGSGLGLSIAKSLTELQSGTFNINIDGDLFKAVITFDTLI